MPAHQQREVLCVWEGEWPFLKAVVSDSRRKLLWGFGVVADVADGRGYVTMAKDTATRSDQAVVEGSKYVSKFVRENPWVVPASGFATFSAFVFAKSLRWGVFSASRNSAVATSIALCVAYPHELRRLALENLPI
ncbi:Hypothetical protein, putative [Bodo saltans]|uniref:Uncharacterized protein n=1 Tax=Bodo saltans TaxID=75058 RepID=A0A0S4JUP0_BODSA|nr:Hypothetical protein, putative [Bodo saltans]|eukprot:CUG92819.1 Hypothetical protein, putative [Bodo saltans]